MNGTVQQMNYTEPQAPGELDYHWILLNQSVNQLTRRTVYLVNGAAGHYDGLDTTYTPLNQYIA